MSSIYIDKILLRCLIYYSSILDRLVEPYLVGRHYISLIISFWYTKSFNGFNNFVNLIWQNLDLKSNLLKVLATFISNVEKIGG